MLLDSTEGIREQIRIENIKRDKRIRLSRILILLVLLVAVLSGLVGWSARNDLHASLAHTAEARVASCQQYNVQQGAQIDAEKVEIRALITALAATSTSPDIGQRVAEFYKVYDRTVDRAHKLRDCTPGGIAKYLKQ